MNGSPQLTGTSSVLGITVLGKELPVDRAVSQTLTVVDTSTSTRRTSRPAARTPGRRRSTRPPGRVLGGCIPDDLVPATDLRVVVTPGKKTEGGGTLTQHALDLTVSVGGQNLVDLTVGSATVGSAAGQLRRRGRPGAGVHVAPDRADRRAAAGPRAAARRSQPPLRRQARAIRFTATGKVVARRVVRSTGLFTATAPLPRRRIRATNGARYIASIGKEKSLRLKLSGG